MYPSPSFFVPPLPRNLLNISFSLFVFSFSVFRFLSMSLSVCFSLNLCLTVRIFFFLISFPLPFYHLGLVGQNHFQRSQPFSVSNNISIVYGVVLKTFFLGKQHFFGPATKASPPPSRA